MSNPGLHSQRTSRFAFFLVMWDHPLRPSAAAAFAIDHNCDHFVCTNDVQCCVLLRSCPGSRLFTRWDCFVDSCKVVCSMCFAEGICSGLAALSYLQLENSQICEEVVRAVIELLGEVIVQDIEVLRVVSVDARDELFDVLGSRRRRDPLICACGFGSHGVGCAMLANGGGR